MLDSVPRIRSHGLYLLRAFLLLKLQQFQQELGPSLREVGLDEFDEYDE